MSGYRPDTLAVEEPLEIQLGGEPFSVTMRTPGDDVDLALGFLFSEGVVARATDVAGAKHCTDSDLNVLDVTLRIPAPEAGRRFTVSSACGACGTSSMDELVGRISPEVRRGLAGDGLVLDSGLVLDLPNRLRAAQKLFDRTGAVHAAGLFDTDGTLHCVREDVGRHNAVDKILGWAWRSGGLPLTGRVLAVSGRIGAEIVHKAAAGGVAAIVAVSAPTTLAVDLAKSWNMTLIGFTRTASFNVYSGAERVRD
ncbi:Sulfur carrier protein FdhD [Stackebrandtia soli]